MIYFFVTRDNLVPICTYKSEDPHGGANRIVPITYDALPAFLDGIPEPSRETFVFADLELLDERELREAASLHARLAAEGAGILNDPRRTMMRAELLKTLAERGINDFKAHPVRDRSAVTFPAFLRSASRHHGSYSPVLHDRKELERAIVSQFLRGRDLEDLLIVEYMDTADRDGIYRKYGTFVVGEKVIPRHILFERHWMLKSAGIEDDWAIREEIDYVQSNPHEEELLEVARIAEVTYGRIDYAVVDGDIVVWEINTNPNFNLSPQNLGPPARAEVNDLFTSRLAAALIEVDRNGSTRDPNESDPLQVCKGVIIDAGHPALLNTSPERRSIVDAVTGRARPVVMPFIERRIDRNN